MKSKNSTETNDVGRSRDSDWLTASMKTSNDTMV